LIRKPVLKPEDVLKSLFFSVERFQKSLEIGQKTTRGTKLLGISKVEKLNCDIQRLTERFGKMGLWLKQAAHSLDFSELRKARSCASENVWFPPPREFPVPISHGAQEKYNVELVMEPLE